MRTEPSPSAIEQAIRDRVERMRNAHHAEGPPTLDARRSDLERLRKMVLAHEDALARAIDGDFRGRSAGHTRTIDILPTVLAAKHALRNVGRWMAPERRRPLWATLPAWASVEPQPLGVVGIVSPWNYPVLLALDPVIGAMAAGNRILLKPSELAPRCAEVLADAVSRTFEPDRFAVITGGVEVGRAFINQRFDHLLFTGSTQVGRIVMRAAAENLTPVTLELGGKSPLVVDRGSRMLELVRDPLIIGKLYNGGQSCVAPDYALVHEEQLDGFVSAFREGVARFFPRIADNPDYVSVIDDRHLERIHELRDDAVAKGARLVVCSDEPDSTLGPRIAPTLVLDVDDGMRIMQEEIFGPLLPVIPFREFGEAIDFVNARPRPLAAYLFSDDERNTAWFQRRTTSGAFVINTTTIHVGQPDLRFGGVGPSGMGAYHGVDGFRTFSHMRGIYQQGAPNLLGVTKPPFDRPLKRRLVDFLMSRWS